MASYLPWWGASIHSVVDKITHTFSTVFPQRPTGLPKREPAPPIEPSQASRLRALSPSPGLVSWDRGAQSSGAAHDCQGWEDVMAKSGGLSASLAPLAMLVLAAMPAAADPVEDFYRG